MVEIICCEEVYKYIIKVKNILAYRLSKQAWYIGCKVKETNKRKISFSKCLTLWSGLVDGE